MKHLISIGLLITSCLGAPTKETNEEQLEVLWNIQTNAIDIPNCPPLVIGDENIVFAGARNLTAINMDTGELVWNGEIPEEIGLQSSIMLFDIENQRVISNHKQSVRVWDAIDGGVLYTLDKEDGILAHIAGNNSVVKNGFGIVGDTLDAYIINNDGSLKYNLDVEFGTSGIAYAEDKVYLAQGKTIHGELTLGRIRVFDFQTKDSLWVYKTEYGGFGEPLNIEENILYGGTRGNSPERVVVALNSENGEVIWEYVTADQLEYTESLLVGPNHIYSGAGGTLLALDKKTGQKKWRFDWTSSTLVRPVYLEGYIYHSDHNQLFVLNAETGELVHTEPVPDGGSYFWHVAASSDKIFAQTSNQLIAYQPWHLRED